LANAKVRGFEAFGPALAGDHARLDLAEVIGDVAQTGSGWTIRRLDVTSPVGTLTGRGTIPAASDSPTTLDGTIDLARLGALLPRTLRLRDGLTLDRGTAGLHAQLSTRDGTERLELSAKITDLAATDRGKPLVVRDPATLSAVVTRSRDNLTVESLVARAAGLDLNAQGDLDRGVTLTGTLDLTTLQAQLRDLIELGDLDVAGRGRLAADYRRAGETYQARFVIEFRGLTIAGLTETPIRREMVRLDGSAIGPRSAQGLPDDWQTARLSLKAGDLRADLTANQRSGAMAVRANASADLTSPTPGRAEVNASLIGQGRVWEIAELRAGIVPTDPQAAPATVAMAARGRVDLDKGDARLTPLPGSSGVALGLAPAGVAIQGLGRTDVPLNVDATLLGDLAAMDRLLAAWSGAVPSGWGGSWSSRVTVSRALSGPIAFDGRVEVANLATPTPQGHLAVAVKGGYHLDADRLDLAALDADSRFGRLLARGAVTAVSAEKRAHLSGTLEPRWDTIQTMLAESVEPRARLEASMRPFRLSGPLTGGTVTEILRGLDGEVGLDVAALEAFGMRVGPTPVVLRLGQGRAVFDPIQTRINDGPTVLLADLALDDPNALWLRLAEGSRIEKAAINDAVSSAVLAYVAPVLSQATQVSGRVSVAARRAALPVLGGGSTEIEGRIVFENVLFQPGPFATEVLTLAGQSVPRLELNQPVQLAVANGRVRQSGLAIPLARDLRVDLAGSVGFDQTVRMKATLPVTGRMLGRNEIAEQIVGGTKITVPIDGTLSRPSLDRRALQVALREAARSLVSRGIETGAGMLLDRLAPGSDRPRPGRAGAAAPNSTGRDALRILEGLGREVLDPRRP
jgi:translocation and assembly module TamB